MILLCKLAKGTLFSIIQVTNEDVTALAPVLIPGLYQ